MLPPQLDSITDLIELFVIHNASFAPFILLFLEESGIPLFVPGDVYVMFVGYQITQGMINYWMAFFLLMISVLVGSSVLYYISFRWGNLVIAKFGRFLHLSEKRLEYIESAFRKYGMWVIIFGRHIPGFRVPITIFSGVSGISYKKFIFSTFISVVFWIAFYLSVGSHIGKRVVRLFHVNYHYLLLLLIPLSLYCLFLLSVHVRNARRNKRV